MTLILNGTDNSATTPAVTGTDTDTGVYYPAANQVAIATSGTQAMLANASQGVQFANAIGVGATTPTTSGVGITFPATQSASTNVNTLDDYEEGTWTPSAGSESGVLTATYGVRTGKYVKIGRWVWCGFDIELTSRTNAGSLAFLYGLPFAVANNGDLSGGVGSIGINFNAGSNFYQIGIYPQNNAVYCYITGTTSNTSNLSAMVQAFWGATTRLCGGFYFMSSD